MKRLNSHNRSSAAVPAPLVFVATISEPNATEAAARRGTSAPPCKLTKAPIEDVPLEDWMALANDLEKDDSMQIDDRVSATPSTPYPARETPAQPDKVSQSCGSPAQACSSLLAPNTAVPGPIPVLASSLNPLVLASPAAAASPLPTSAVVPSTNEGDILRAQLVTANGEVLILRQQITVLNSNLVRLQGQATETQQNPDAELRAKIKELEKDYNALKSNLEIEKKVREAGKKGKWKRTDRTRDTATMTTVLVLNLSVHLLLFRPSSLEAI